MWIDDRGRAAQDEDVFTVPEPPGGLIGMRPAETCQMEGKARNMVRPPADRAFKNPGAGHGACRVRAVRGVAIFDGNASAFKFYVYGGAVVAVGLAPTSNRESQNDKNREGKGLHRDDPSGLQVRKIASSRRDAISGRSPRPTRTMSMKAFFYISVALIVSMPCRSLAASLPSEFHGTWILANTVNNQCKRDDWRGLGQSNDALIRVNANGFEEFESFCRIEAVDFKPPPGIEPSNLNVEVDLKCSGEGMSSRQKSIWHVQTIDGRKLLTMTAIRQWDARDDLGRKTKPLPMHARTLVFLECS
jgi:hypothetical protein